jgi:WD40 repeat protein
MLIMQSGLARGWRQFSLLFLSFPIQVWNQSNTWQAGVAQIIAKGRSPGTGFVVEIRPGRVYLITAAHVVEGDPNPTVIFLSDPAKKRYDASIQDVQGGDSRGLALLQVENPPGGLRTIEPGANARIAAGTLVTVAGFPLPIGAFHILPVTVGSVKGLDLNLSPETGNGFSGGPVLLESRAVGMVFGRDGGFGKALPAGLIELYLRNLGIDWVSRDASAKTSPPSTTAAPSGITGRWVIEATPKTPKTYLNFSEVLEGKLYGNTEMLFSAHPDMTASGLFNVRQTGIFDGEVSGSRVAFKTKRPFRPNFDAVTKDLIHKYEGRVSGNTIRFAVQVEGGYYEEVTAERVVPDENPAAQRVATLEGHTGAVEQMRLLSDVRLASASRDGTVKIWNLQTLKNDVSFTHGSQMKAIVPLSGGRILCADYDGRVKIWDLRTEKELLTFQEIPGLLGDVVALADGRFAGGWSNGEITLWNTTTGRIEKTLKVDDRWILKMAQLQDARLVTGDQDGTIRIWNLASGNAEVIVRKGSPLDSVTGLVALKDGRRLAYSTQLGRDVTIWNLSSSQEEIVTPLKKRKGAEVLGLFEDGRVAIGDGNSDFTLWDPATARSEVIVSLGDVDYGITSVVKLPDGRIAVGMGDGQISLWKPRK